MSAVSPQVFYSSKPRLVHVALNIALAPALLYLVGLWSLPPSLPHYVTFAITGLIAHRYARQRWSRPRLVLDEDGLHCGAFYPADSIQRVDTVMRALKLQVLVDGAVSERVIGLGWASNDDFKRIVQLLAERFNRS